MIKKLLFLLTIWLWAGLWASPVFGEVGTSDYGVYFYSHNSVADNRTSLVLNEGNGIALKNGLTIGFNIDLRGSEPAFGNMLSIVTDNGLHLDALVAERNGAVAAINVDGRLSYMKRRIVAKDNIDVCISLDRNKGLVTYRFDGEELVLKTDLSGVKTVMMTFGTQFDINRNDVLPMNLRNVCIDRSGKKLHFWSLKEHQGNNSLDEVDGMMATTKNGRWIADDHRIPKHLLHYKSKEHLQIAFNNKERVFYIAGNNSILCFKPDDGSKRTITVNGGYRAMEYSNFMAYSSHDKVLYNYNPIKGMLTRFNFETQTWDNTERVSDEPEQCSHSWAEADDSTAYMFGGYGFYKFDNRLYRMNHRNGTIVELDYSPRIEPRVNAAMAVVGNKLYIFGGFGNAEGKQELPCHYYYDLQCIDLETMKSHTVWKSVDKKEEVFVLSEQMYYNKQENCFYAATTNRTGRILRISMDKPEWTIVSDMMGRQPKFKDLGLAFYCSEDGKKMYVVYDLRLNSLEHVVNIYSIDTPLMGTYPTSPEKSGQDLKVLGVGLLNLILAIVIAIVIVIVLNRRRRSKEAPQTDSNNDNSDLSKNAEENIDVEEVVEENVEEDIEENKKTKTYYQQTTNKISVLGKFSIIDINGEDISAQFTKRMRDLLLLILLYCTKKRKGVENRVLDDTLWQGKDEISARNNRNVYISKLRMLLKNMGGLELLNDNKYYYLEYSEDFFFDYAEAMRLFAHTDEADEEDNERLIELLYEGPLLPDYSFEWLDDFKADFSDRAISFLMHHMRRAVREGEDVKASRIAMTIMKHDPFNDIALATHCQSLCRRHKRGIAKNAYDNFCKNYQQCMAEEYHLSFNEVVKA